MHTISTDYRSLCLIPAALLNRNVEKGEFDCNECILDLESLLYNTFGQFLRVLVLATLFEATFWSLGIKIIQEK